MSANAVAPALYAVKISDVSCSCSDSFDVILEKAGRFYSTFLEQRSFLARRDDLNHSATTWAVLCFREEEEAVKCAQWLSNEPLLSRAGTSSSSLETRVQVFHRVQAPSNDLVRATAEANKYTQEVSKWEQANKSLLPSPAPPLKNASKPKPSLKLGTSVVPNVKPKARTPQGAISLGDHSETTALLPHSPLAKRQKPSTSPPRRAAVVPMGIKEAPVPQIDEKKISKSKEMIAEGLGKAMDKSTARSSKVMRLEIANSIVEAILALKIDTHHFSDKIRLLQFNLSKNADLRTSVLEGTIAPEILASMKSSEMETKEQAKKRKEIDQKSLKTHIVQHADLEFGYNIGAALQLKREALGYKDIEFSPPSTYDATKDVAPSGGEKRLREEHGGDSDSKQTVEGTLENTKPPKKSVKFDAVQINTVQNPTNPKSGFLKHPSSLGVTSSHLAYQQIDWGPLAQHEDPNGWQPHSILADRGQKIYRGNLAWKNATNEHFHAEVEVVGFQPQAFIRLPRSLDIVESTSLDEMKRTIIESGAQPWHLHRAWICGPQMPEPKADRGNEIGAEKRENVGKILVNSNGEVLRSYNEGWTKGSHVGWQLFICEPTPAACEAASALIQEREAARKSHALLMIAVPHYWGELLPLGENGVRQHLEGSKRIYVSASGASTLLKLPKTIKCELKAHRSRMNLSSIWDSVFITPNVRMYPRQTLEEGNKDEENIAAFDALEKRLRANAFDLDTADALICQQQEIPCNMDLAVASGCGPDEISGGKTFLLFGCWHRKILPGIGHQPIDFRETYHSWPA